MTMRMMPVKRIAFNDQIRYLLVLVNDLYSFLDPFSYLLVLLGLSSDVGALYFHEKCCHQIGHRCEGHVFYGLLRNLAFVFVDERLCLE